MSTKPVVVYGASGYTGRLVCEYLREHNIPFIAAGRSKDRLASSMERNVPGIETADYEIAEVEHSVDGLTKLLTGAKVLINTVGPFAEYGHEAVQACLAAGCHYTDTNGEQDWMIDCDEKYGQEFANAGLLLSPGVAQMYTTGEIAAQIALEQLPGLHTLDIEVFWKGAPTLASTATILVNAALAKAHYLEENQYVEWPADAGLYQVVVPGQHELGLALPWGGTSHPVWFKHDPRVQNVKVLGGIINRPLMMAVPQLVAAILAGRRRSRPRAEAGRPPRAGGRGHSADAAPGEPPDQHLRRLRPRLRAARPGPHRDLRELQLQADRSAQRLRRRPARSTAATARSASPRPARPSGTRSSSVS